MLQKTLDPGFQLLTLTQLRFACIIHVMYFGCIRAEEALELLTENVVVSPNRNLQLIVQNYKTNQYKQVKNIYLIPALESAALAECDNYPLV